MFLVTHAGSGLHHNKTALKQAYTAASIGSQKCRGSNTVTYIHTYIHTYKST